MVESIALWTIRCSIACYVVAVGLQLRHRSPDRLRKFVWAAGAVLCVIHVVTAMAAFHDFSHVDSMRHTAEVTARVVGLNWGGGVYVNYLFTGSCLRCAQHEHRVTWIFTFPLGLSDSVVKLAAGFRTFADPIQGSAARTTRSNSVFPSSPGSLTRSPKLASCVSKQLCPAVAQRCTSSITA